MGTEMWKWEDEEDDGEGVGPYCIDDGPASDVWVRRSEAERLARDGGHTFEADE